MYEELSLGLKTSVCSLKSFGKHTVFATSVQLLFPHFVFLYIYKILFNIKSKAKPLADPLEGFLSLQKQLLPYSHAAHIGKNMCVLFIWSWK